MTELLRYEVPGKGRHYLHPVDGHRMPSVTNVLGVLAEALARCLGGEGGTRACRAHSWKCAFRKRSRKVVP